MTPRVTMPRAHGFASPLLDPAALSVTVNALGEYCDEFGSHSVSVAVERVVGDDGTDGRPQLHVADDYAARMVVGIEGAGSAPGGGPALEFASSTGLRAFVALLVAATAEAERRGLLADAPSEGAP